MLSMQDGASRTFVIATVIGANREGASQGEHLEHLLPPKLSKHCIAILTFAETFEE